MPNLARLPALLALAAAWPAIALAAPAPDQAQPLVVPLSQQGCFAVGGYYHQSLAQVVTAGRAGALVAVAAPVVCNGDATLSLEIRGVHVDGAGRVLPDGTVRATATFAAGSLPYFADPEAPDYRVLPLPEPVSLAAGERFAFVLSSPGECALAQAPAGDLYAGGNGWFIDDIHREYFEWVGLGLGRLDLPFETWMDGAAPPAAALRIDVKPGSDENPVNLRARGVLPVAILGSPSFDVGTVDLGSVTFAGASPVGGKRGQPKAAVEDVNGDGSPDLVLHFRIQDLALAADDVEAWLTCRTLGPEGVELAASDRIRIVPAKRQGRVF